ncbi:anthranilate synthase component I family protein [Allomuricauda sp. SCSIO 65647]|uniref:anthranilate synthase component I family protein n=1 Tax=Allomuricauda sp. SCSIO 65647 TaxID=2908843 RepID=UPI001F475DC3|nr:anthranilate synthase component I family protein [Muricauda sp. SCSIO 65647]UJH67499.1 anthranilate synthase component I family protein [Muricauda sp. SCSIO 65647]
MRKERLFQVSKIERFKKGLLRWAQQYEKVIWLDGNGHEDRYSSFETLLAVGSSRAVSFSDIASLDEYVNDKNDWLFGYFSYDFKNRIENLDSNNHDGLGFDELHFFCPDKLILIRENRVEFLYRSKLASEIEKDFASVTLHSTEEVPIEASTEIKIKLRIHRDAYFEKIQKLLNHIHRGDIYEANFCQEFYAEDTELQPMETYLQLNAISRPPFAGFMKLGHRYLMCASPERYLKKMGDKVISQPIKGTAPRSEDSEKDAAYKTNLQNDTKERAENIMITDLVRNDLSRSALKGSVEVEELCHVYSFEQVHQMISTISCRVVAGTKPVDLIMDTFPMGSMTGAPKISAMKIIESLEETKRGLYSGAVGYFTPDGDFDFNVVIRSILYNQAKKYVSYSVGSAITAKSNPEKEYQECLLKAKAMRSVLEGN